MTITVQQEDILVNKRNKTRLIHIQKRAATAGIDTILATDDIDASFVRCRLDKAAMHPTVAIVREDVDLILLSVALAPSSESNIYFMKLARGKVETKSIFCRHLQRNSISEILKF